MKDIDYRLILEIYYLHTFTLVFMNRYIRQQILTEIQLSGQEILRNSKVLIIGIGGLGCPAALYLAGAGIGTIGLIDHDVVDITNLHRQVLFSEKDIGKNKAATASRELSLRNSENNYHIYTEKFTLKNGAEILSMYDVIIDATDDIETKMLINDLCVSLGKPLVYGALYQYSGQVSVFNLYKDSSANLRCLFPTRESMPLPNCSEAGILGPLCGLVGSIQAMETLKILLCAEDILDNKLLIIDTKTWKQKLLKFKRNQYNPLFKNNLVKKQRNEDTITVKELHQMQKDNLPLQLIDVREPHEKEIVDIGGELIPMSLIPLHLEKLKKDIPLIIYCRTGGRSGTIVRLLQEKYGFVNAVNLDGGIYAWAKYIDPSLTLY